MYSSLIVIDASYDQPKRICEAAFGFDYPEVTGVRPFPGRNSRQKLLPQGLDAVVSRIVMEPLKKAGNRESYRGHFRITLAAERAATPGRG